MTVSNQTNLAIKGIIAIEAMSKMSSVVKQTDDTDKYSVCASSFVCHAAHLLVRRVQLRHSTSNGRALDWAATSISLRRMGKLTRGLWGTIYSRMCGWALSWWNSRLAQFECPPFAISDQFQVYNAHSDFLNYLMSNSNFSDNGMPIDNAVPTDTSVAASSWYLYDCYVLLLTGFRV